MAKGLSYRAIEAALFTHNAPAAICGKWISVQCKRGACALQQYRVTMSPLNRGIPGTDKDRSNKDLSNKVATTKVRVPDRHVA